MSLQFPEIESAKVLPDKPLDGQPLGLPLDPTLESVPGSEKTLASNCHNKVELHDPVSLKVHSQIPLRRKMFKQETNASVAFPGSLLALFLISDPQIQPREESKSQLYFSLL